MEDSLQEFDDETINKLKDIETQRKKKCEELEKELNRVKTEGRNENQQATNNLNLNNESLSQYKL